MNSIINILLYINIWVDFATSPIPLIKSNLNIIFIFWISLFTSFKFHTLISILGLSEQLHSHILTTVSNTINSVKKKITI